MNNPLLSEAIGVYYLGMDTAVEEQISFNSDGSFSIFINAKLNYERQMLAYQHAIQHIMQNYLWISPARSLTRPHSRQRLQVLL